MTGMGNYFGGSWGFTIGLGNLLVKAYNRDIKVGLSRG